MKVTILDGTPEEIKEYLKEEVVTEEELEAQFLLPSERKEMVLQYLRDNGRSSTQEMNRHFNWGKYYTNYALRGGDNGQNRGLEADGLVKRCGHYHWEAVE